MGFFCSCLCVAIEACRQQLSGTTTENNMHGQSESSEQTTSNDVPPVVEEFFPIKRSASSDDDEEEQQSHQTKKEKVVSSDSKKNLDWLRSVQLWNNPASDPQPKEVTGGKEFFFFYWTFCNFDLLLRKFRRKPIVKIESFFWDFAGGT